MASNRVEAIIDGQAITLTSSEDEEYIRKVANYIDNKLAEITRIKSGKMANPNTRWLLLALNVADEYFKAAEENASLKEKNAGLQKEFDDYIEVFGKL